jgi:hypothetical protein
MCVCIVLFFEARSHYIDQAGLELTILLNWGVVPGGSV